MCVALSSTGGEFHGKLGHRLQSSMGPCELLVFSNVILGLPLFFFPSILPSFLAWTILLCSCLMDLSVNNLNKLLIISSMSAKCECVVANTDGCGVPCESSCVIAAVPMLKKIVCFAFGMLYIRLTKVHQSPAPNRTWHLVSMVFKI